MLDRQRETGAALVRAELRVQGRIADILQVTINITISQSCLKLTSMANFPVTPVKMASRLQAKVTAFK